MSTGPAHWPHACIDSVFFPMQAGTAHWPYTWGDCELSFALREHQAGKYCPDVFDTDVYPHSVDCTRMRGYFAQLNAMAIPTTPDLPMELFEESTFQWTHYFYKGVNKLAALGAHWGNNVVRTPVLLCSLWRLCSLWWLWWLWWLRAIASQSD